MVDERQNTCPYDFKNMMFTHPHDIETYPDFYFTFSNIGNNVIKDASLEPLTCLNNVIKPYFDSTAQTLNFIVFLGVNLKLYGNSFGDGCYSNSFGDGGRYNSFGNDCHHNSFGNDCHHNSFGHNCHHNSFGHNCHHNSFGDSCGSNSFGDSCGSNSFGDDCYSNSFKNSEGEVTAYVEKISFGNRCISVILQNDVTASSSQQIQNYRIANGMSGTVEVTRGLAHETTIAMATDGTIKQFNLADLAN